MKPGELERHPVVNWTQAGEGRLHTATVGLHHKLTRQADCTFQTKHLLVSKLPVSASSSFNKLGSSRPYCTIFYELYQMQKCPDEIHFTHTEVLGAQQFIPQSMKSAVKLHTCSPMVTIPQMWIMFSSKNIAANPVSSIWRRKQRRAEPEIHPSSSSSCILKSHAFLAFLGHFKFWMGIWNVLRCNGLGILNPKHMWKS